MRLITSLWPCLLISVVKFKIYEGRRGCLSEEHVELQIREKHEREICKIEWYKNVNNLEASDLSWQEWIWGWRYYSNCLSGATLGDPPPPNGTDWGGGGLPVMRVMAPEAVWCPSLDSSLSLASLTTALRAIAHETAAINKALQSWGDELTGEEQKTSQVTVKLKKSAFCSRQNCVDRLDPSEEAVPKLSNCLTSERAIPNYMMKPHVLGTPTPSSSLYAVLMKHDFVCIITDKERARFDLELQLNPKQRGKQERTV